MLLNIFSWIGNMFANMHWIIIALIVIAYIFSVVEAIVPGFGVFGILGVVFECIAIIIHAVISKSPLQIVFLVIMVFVLYLLLFLISMLSAKYGLLSKSPLIETKTSIPTDYGEQAKKDLNKLINQKGIVLTDLKTVGKIKIKNKVYEAE